MRKLGVASLFLAGLAGSLQGQEIAAGEAVVIAPAYAPSTPEYGAAGLTSVVIGATDFVPPDSEVNYTTESLDGIFRYQTGPPVVDWRRSVRLPNGAIIESLQLHACDTSPTGEIRFWIRRADTPGSEGEIITPITGTGPAATPGCAFFSVTPNDPPVVVDNANSAYLVTLQFHQDFSGGVKAGSVRVSYRLQVSPAPSSAAFTDVPTSHPFFRFVEALASAGITGGCGGGQYCPESPVTRGQMAVFLSVALGLHFPN